MSTNLNPFIRATRPIYTSSGLDHYQHSDFLGSVRLGSTTTRSVSFDVAYAPFGETYNQSGTPDLSFAGNNQDTISGNYDAVFRQYSTQGRWPSPDPAGLAAVDPTDPQSFNRYAYVGNSPLNFIDPSGLGPHTLSLQCPPPSVSRGCVNSGGGGSGGSCLLDGIETDCGFALASIGVHSPFDLLQLANTPTGQIPNPAYWNSPACRLGDCPNIPTTLPVYGNAGVVNLLYLFAPGGPQNPTVKAAPTLKFKPPSWQNFTHQFLPCYAGQLLGNSIESPKVTFGTIALFVTKPKVGGPLLVLWTGIVAYKAATACTLASRAVYE